MGFSQAHFPSDVVLTPPLVLGVGRPVTLGQLLRTRGRTGLQQPRGHLIMKLLLL